MKQYADLDFSKAAKIMNVLVDPVASDDTGLGTGQMWFNTTSKFFKGYDGTTKFQLLRDDLAATITGVFTFNPSTGSVPFAVHSSKTGVVTYLNADEVDGYDAAEAATASTLAARDASGNLTVATPTSDGHAATKAYVDSIAAGQDWKDSCLVATTANITLSGTQTIDGVAVVADDRVLVKDQTTASENGIYVCAAGAWSRAADADENAEVTSGLTTYIEQGTDNAGAGYTLTTSGVIVVGTTALTFTRTSGGSVYSDGNGMVKSGTTFHFAQAASYTVGALPYADSASTIGFIAAVASGKVLKSNGTGTVPLWAAVDLTADVTGTLPVDKGGTGTATQFTQGSVIVAGASGVYSQNPSKLFWDNTNYSLGVGGAADSTYCLRVYSGMRLDPGSGNVAININAWDFLKWDNGSELHLGGYTASQWNTLRLYTSGNSQIYIDALGNVTLSTLASSSSDSVVTENSGVLEKRTINSGVWGTQTAGRLLVSNGSGVITTDSGLIYDPGTGRTAFNRSAGVYSDAAVTITMKDLAVASNITSNEMVLYLEATVGNNIAAGVTDSGYRAGLVISAQVADLDFAGTLGSQYGVKLSHGATITTAGSIINDSYGIFIESNTTANTTIGNLWALYQANSAAKNYFAGNVGINNPDPSGKFDVIGTTWIQGSFRVAQDYNASYCYKADRTTLLGYTLFRDDGSAQITALRCPSFLGFYVSADGNAGSPKMVIDTSGKMGVGTDDPTASLDVNGAFRFRATDSVYEFGHSAALAVNAYYSGGWNYRSSDYAVKLAEDAGKWVFSVAASGTADAEIAWTNALTINNNGTLTAHVLNTGTGNSVLTEESGVIKKRTINSAAWTGETIWHSGNDGASSGLDADLLDGQHGSYFLDLANSTGDTDDISEGLTNLFYTDARARAAISSTASAQIAYNSTTGVLGLGTEAGRVKSGTLGAGASPTFTHSLGTRNVLCQVFRNSSPYDEVRPEIKRTDTNTVTVEFTGITPSSGDFIIVCSAANG